MDSAEYKRYSEWMRNVYNQKEKAKADRKKWLALTEEYFVSRGGSLLVKYSDFNKFIEVCGFEFYIVSVENAIKPFLDGKRIMLAPDYIMPTPNWEN